MGEDSRPLMPFSPPSDYWLEISAGRYRVGLTPAEAKRLAHESAAYLKEQGAEFSLNEGKMLRRAAVLLDTTGNPRWVEQYLLAHYPAREVELPAFAIAKRPIDNRLYRQFMDETGETQGVEAWGRGFGQNVADDLPAVGISWWIAMALAEWAGARLPFEDEWERAVRGSDHRLFPWGDDHLPLGGEILKNRYPKALPSETTRTPEGLEGAVAGQAEWCADLWRETPGIDPPAWGDEVQPSWTRALRGGAYADRFVPSAVLRASAGRYTYFAEHETAQVRLVRGDGRVIPGPDPTTPKHLLATGTARALESRLVAPALASLAGSRIGREHRVLTSASGYFSDLKEASKLWLAATPGGSTVTTCVEPDPTTWTAGQSLAAVSKESIRRIPKEHGIFLWTIQYRVAEDGSLRARPVVVFHMAFNRALHRFENRFRPHEPDMLAAELTADMIRASVLDAFQFYEIHADADEDPFQSPAGR